MEITRLLLIGLNTLEGEQEHPVDRIHDLVAVVLESHIKIETGELGQVLVVGVVTPEDKADFVPATYQ